MAVPFLQFVDATLIKAGSQPIKKFNFTIEQGQQWAVTGHPEEAKTSLLEVLAGRIPVTHGSVHHHYAAGYLTLPANGTYRSHHDLVCLVPFHHHFRNRSNVQNFYYQQRFNSMDADDAATVSEYLSGITPKNPDICWTADSAMALLGLEAFADKSLIKLSNGETRRLMLATALVRNPKLLLLESPLVGLDAATRTRFNGILESIIASGIHVVLTTSPQEIPEAITHVIVLENGHIAAQGRRADISLPDVPVPSPRGLLNGGFGETLTHLLTHNGRPVAAPIVDMKNVTIAYGDKTILDRVNWTVMPAEAWALRGHNGAGKSTLLSLINGDNPQAYRNEITLFGRRRGTGESIWDIKRNIGYVSPELHQYFPKHQTALQVTLSGYFDTVGLFRQVSDTQRDNALQWLQLFGLADIARLRLAQLSPDKQRLCLLARAVIKNPALLILDEPCQGLSPDNREFFKALINEIHYVSGTTVIFVSHYDEDIPSCVSRQITLEQGKVK